MKIKDIASWVLFPIFFEIVSVGTLVCTMILLPSCIDVTHLKEPRTPCTSRLHVVGQHCEHEIVEPSLGVLRVG